jgi:hypothetical protein
MQLTCPKCRGEMRQYERSGVTIDQCTECRGIFLDRGELEKLFEAEANWNQQFAPRPPQPSTTPPATGGAYVPPPPPPPSRPGYVAPGHVPTPSHVPPPPPPAHGYPAPVYGHPYGYHGHHRPKRRKGFLEELFD